MSSAIETLCWPSCGSRWRSERSSVLYQGFAHESRAMMCPAWLLTHLLFATNCWNAVICCAGVYDVPLNVAVWNWICFGSLKLFGMNIGSLLLDPSALRSARPLLPPTMYENFVPDAACMMNEMSVDFHGAVYVALATMRCGWSNADGPM